MRLFKRRPPVYHDIYPVAPSRRRFINLSQRSLVILLVCTVTVLGSGVFLIRSVLKAEELITHPTACLGGWQNSERAQGKLVEDASNLHAFAEETSAILPADTAAEIYCGGFIGDIPPATAPTSMTLFIAWSTERGEAPPVVSGEDFASSSGEVLDAPSGTDPSFELVEPAPSEPAPTEPSPEPIAPEPPPEPLPQPEPESAPAPEPEPEPAPEPEPSPEPSPVSFLRKLIATARAQELEPVELPIDLPIEEPAEELPPVLPDAAFIEVRYTFDGVTWYTLDTFDEAHIVPTTFSIPVPPQASWTTLGSFQVSVQSRPTIDGVPPVYLDGMELRIGYDTTGTRFFADKDLYSTEEIILITSSEPQSSVMVYWLDDPDTAPEASHVYAAIVGDDGTVALEAKTLFPGRFALINTNDRLHCTQRYLSQCRLRGGIAEITIEVARPEDIPRILAERESVLLASSTPPVAEESSDETPSEEPPVVIEVPSEPAPVPEPLAPEPPPPVETPEPEPEPVVPLQNDVPDAPPAAE